VSSEPVSEPVRLVRQMDEAVLDHGRLRVQAHDLVGRKTARIDPLRAFESGPAAGGEPC
jgi:hypothetical protein